MLNNVDPTKFFSFVHILSGKSSLQDFGQVKFLSWVFWKLPETFHLTKVSIWMLTIFLLFTASSPLHLSRPEPKNQVGQQQQIRSSLDMVRVYNYGPQSLQQQNANLMVICNSNFSCFLYTNVARFWYLASSSSWKARHDVSFRWSQQSLQPSSYFRLFRLFWIACLQQLQYV